MQSRSSGARFVAGAAVLWGTTGLIARISPPDVGPAALGQARLLIGGVVLGLACTASRPRRSVATPTPSLDRASVILGSCALALFQWTFFVAVAHAGVAVASVLSTALAPLASDQLARRGRRSAAGLRLSFGLGAAAALAASSSLFAHARLSDAISGAAAASLSAFAYALYTHQSARLQRSDGSGLASTALMLFGAGLALTPLALPHWPALLTPRGLCLAAYLGLATCALAYAAFTHGLRALEPSTALALLALQPLTAAGLGWLVLGETLDPALLLALTWMFTAAWLRPSVAHTELALTNQCVSSKETAR